MSLAVGQTIGLCRLSFSGLARHDRVEKPHPDTHRARKRRVPSMWGRLPTCAAVGYRRRSAANVAVGRLTIGRSLPSCPTTRLALAPWVYHA